MGKKFLGNDIGNHNGILEIGNSWKNVVFIELFVFVIAKFGIQGNDVTADVIERSILENICGFLSNDDSKVNFGNNSKMPWGYCNVMSLEG